MEIEAITEDAEGEATEELVKDSEKYAVYFKMIRMGVPIQAVKNKMTQKGVNPLILDLGEEATMSRVAALEKAFELEGQKKNVTSKQKNQIIFWEAIPETRLDNKPTIFGGDDIVIDENKLELVDDMLQLFQKKQQPPPSSPKSGDDPSPNIIEKKSAAQTILQMLKAERVESVLEARRAQAVAIVMKKLQIVASDPSNFLRAVQELDQTYLTAQRIEILLSCPLWPINDEEHRTIKQKSDRGEKLAEPDKIILTTIETIPDVASKLNSLAFRWEFENHIVETMRTAAEVKHASKLLVGNENLKKVARCAIMIGNTLNRESGVIIKGCTLGSLVKLANTKSTQDKDVSVLDVVVAYMMKVQPDSMSLVTLIPSLALAKKCELEASIKKIREMRRGLEAIRRIPQLQVFAYEGMLRLDAVESEMGVARDFFGMALNFVGARDGEMECNVFFEVIFAFVDSWEKTVEKKQKLVKSQAQALAQAAANAKRAADKALQKTVPQVIGELEARMEKSPTKTSGIQNRKTLISQSLGNLFKNKQNKGVPITKSSVNANGPLQGLKGLKAKIAEAKAAAEANNNNATGTQPSEVAAFVEGAANTEPVKINRERGRSILGVTLGKARKSVLGDSRKSNLGQMNGSTTEPRKSNLLLNLSLILEARKSILGLSLSPKSTLAPTLEEDVNNTQLVANKDGNEEIPKQEITETVESSKIEKQNNDNIDPIKTSFADGSAGSISTLDDSSPSKPFEDVIIPNKDQEVIENSSNITETRTRKPSRWLRAPSIFGGKAPLSITDTSLNNHIVTDSPPTIPTEETVIIQE